MSASAVPSAAPFAGHTGQVTAVAVTPDGSQVITGDGTARVWDRATGTQTRIKLALLRAGRRGDCWRNTRPAPWTRRRAPRPHR
ncbi:MAG: hypothetical protein M3Z25_11340 [Actinomycetota bacterium]|nr:hypothetical protein [Actinomycetota bacterium]